jgi:mutator protein MutT
MDNFRNAVKAFIVKNGEVLLIRRRSNDVHKPGEWDIPGGRLGLGEDPIAGLKREVQEEVGINVDIEMPIDIHHFTRDDGQKITMIIFWCIPLSTDIVLSEEHQEHKWISLENIDEFPQWMITIREVFLKHALNQS